MSNETTPRIENLEQQDQELTPEQAEEAQGGFTIALGAKPTLEIGVVPSGDRFVGENY